MILPLSCAAGHQGRTQNKAYMGSQERSSGTGNGLLRGVFNMVYIALLPPFGIDALYLFDRLRIRRRPEKWAERDPKGMDIVAARRQW